MSELMTQIGQFLSSGAGKAVEGAGVAGTGFLQNFMANREAQKKQKFVEDLITNPAKFNAFVSGFEKPLQAGLTNNVSRMTDAYGAERGLGSSPAIMKDVYAQALAPYLLQQQQSAENAALQSLGIYEQSPTTKPMDVSSILKMLMMSPNKSGAGPNPAEGINLSEVPNTPLDPSQLGLTGQMQLPPPTVSGGFDPTTMEGG